MQLPLTFGNYTGRSIAQNGQILQNMIMEIDQQGGKENFFLFTRPGLKTWLSLGESSPVRGFCHYGTIFIVVVGSNVYSVVLATKAKTLLATISSTTGVVQFAENANEIMFIAGGGGYVYTKATGVVAIISDVDFPATHSLTYQDGYAIVASQNTGRFYISAVNDFTTWDALEFVTAEAAPDNLVAVLSDHQDVWAFGTKTIEPYVNTANVDFPFERRGGAMLEVGCGAVNSVTKGENILFWLDNNGLVRKAEGYSPVIISTRQIEYQISQFSTFSDAQGMFCVIGGHSFYILTFPTGGKTFVYDLSTQQWYLWASFDEDGRWRPMCLVQDGSTVYAGDYANGLIYTLDEDTFTDYGNTLRWIATTKEVHADRKKIRHRLLELDLEAATVGNATDPKVVMSYSDDRGVNYGNEHWASMGKIGEYKHRAVWRRLGISRGRVYKFTGTDPVKAVLLSVNLDGEPFE